MLQIAAFISIVLAATGFASTPGDAALRFLAVKGGTIAHVSRAGTFAVVSFEGPQ